MSEGMHILHSRPAKPAATRCIVSPICPACYVRTTRSGRVCGLVPLGIWKSGQRRRQLGKRCYAARQRRVSSEADPHAGSMGRVIGKSNGLEPDKSKRGGAATHAASKLAMIEANGLADRPSLLREASWEVLLRMRCGVVDV